MAQLARGVALVEALAQARVVTLEIGEFGLQRGDPVGLEVWCHRLARALASALAQSFRWRSVQRAPHLMGPVRR
ncbi:hypothetical protein ASG52_23560 [Methylobacterium sp. Leaf456]|uniref:hypothetical protein n=1 Tax=Methylobacterium sp. Leaf456 TaxID=1736382 RepID=UPI0006FEEB2F|nr:hypothetical protein [Methylobacterium sp. Leaf456]KQT57606.1 hypothetical protein ASG52_23560 [Methylobacterium sp. Leaf456]